MLRTTSLVPDIARAGALMASGEFRLSIELLQQVLRASPSESNGAHFMFAKNYMCLGCHHQSYYHLIKAWEETQGKDETSQKVTEMLVKCSCKIANFTAPIVVIERTTSLTPEDKQKLTRYTMEEKAKFLHSIEETMKDIQSPFGQEEMRKIFMTGQMIKCRIPFLPSYARKSEIVLTTINRKLAELGIDTIELRVVPGTRDCYGLFAKRDIPRGQVVLQERPYVVVNGDISTKRCYHCCRNITGRPVPCVDQCAVIYCSQDCMVRALEEYHTPLCGVDMSPVVAMVAKGRSSTSRFPLMYWKVLGKALMSCIAAKGGELPEIVPLEAYPSRCNGLDLLYRHSGSRDYEMSPTALPIHEMFSNMLGSSAPIAYNTHVFLGVEWVIDCAELLLLNGISVPMGSEDILQQSQALLPIGSFINHSATPNCEWIGRHENTDLKVVFTATRPISSGEQVCISYSKEPEILKLVYEI